MTWKRHLAHGMRKPGHAKTPLDTASSAKRNPCTSPRKRAFSASSSATRTEAGSAPAASSARPSNQSEVVPNTRHSCLIVLGFGSFAPDSYFAHACCVKPSFVVVCVCVKLPRSSFIRSETFSSFFPRRAAVRSSTRGRGSGKPTPSALISCVCTLSALASSFSPRSVVKCCKTPFQHLSGWIPAQTRMRGKPLFCTQNGMVGYSGFEPLTSSMSRKRSNQLS